MPYYVNVGGGSAVANPWEPSPARTGRGGDGDGDVRRVRAPRDGAAAPVSTARSRRGVRAREPGGRRTVGRVAVRRFRVSHDARVDDERRPALRSGGLWCELARGWKLRRQSLRIRLCVPLDRWSKAVIDSPGAKKSSTRCTCTSDPLLSVADRIDPKQLTGAATHNTVLCRCSCFQKHLTARRGCRRTADYRWDGTSPCVPGRTLPQGTWP